MGQKVHPYGFRIGVNRTWASRWFAEKKYSQLLHEDIKIREELKKAFVQAGISKVEIDRLPNQLKVRIHTSKPGLVIGKKGAGVDQLKRKLEAQVGREVVINIEEVVRPELDAQLVSEQIAFQLEKRVAFRRAMRRSVESSRKFGAKGIKVRCKGRLNGAEIARAEWYLFGRLPLTTLRADIDYGFAEAKTSYGVIGVKVWIFKGERVNYMPNKPEDRRERAQ
ncbi:30S ribosomal protein S3 [bacterium]|nr:30S ribosomal protein S3 [bacterium]MCI0614604.1 30S ribosomal protein S3 [bacterium]